MPKKEFTATEVMALQEETLKEVKIIGEQYSYIKEKVDKIDKIEEDIEILKEDIQVVKMSLTRKVDVDDFQAFGKKVIRLEKHLAQ